MEIEVRQLTSITDQVLDDFNLLLAVLSDNTSLTFDNLLEIINSNNSFVFIAVANGSTVGALTLIVNRIPTGLKAWIEDVVVSERVQGKGIGRLLIERAISHAKTLNIKSVNLTSRPSRVAANILYTKIGFIKRDTNVYMLEL